MILVVKQDITENQETILRSFLAKKNVDVVSVKRKDQLLLVVTGKFGELTKQEVGSHKFIESVIDTDRPYKLASKQSQTGLSQFAISETTTIGGAQTVYMAGPCSVESEEQIMRIARDVKASGCTVLRGGAFKPRTAPYDFQGHGKVGLQYLRRAADAFGLSVITEILDVRDIDLVHRYTDIFQVGTRNMQNYPLLKELGRSNKPVLLKRGMWATYKEFLLAAEYILVGGNEKVILCERGIRTHVNELRFTLDLNAIPYLKHETHLPVMADPSHGTGRANLVRTMSKASIAAGADGLLLEVHYDPRMSVSDADQAISTQELYKLVKECRRVAKAIDRK